MKFSKILSYVAQFVNFLWKAITGAEKNIIDAGNANTTKVEQAVAASEGKVVAAVAETAKTNTELAKEHQRVVVERLDAIAATESEEELRKAVEPYLPEEALKDFKW